MSYLKRLNKEIQLYKEQNFSFDNLLIQPSDTLDTWYFIIHDLKDTDYTGGIYLGKVLVPPKYPFVPVDLVFLTSNGRFETNKKICTSFTGFHKDLWSPSWNIASMLAGLISFMTDSQDTIESKGLGGITMTTSERQKIAINSIDEIKTNEIYKRYFQNNFDFDNILFKKIKK
jgi:ubiquitin-conjugating enzyme E2 J1